MMLRPVFIFISVLVSVLCLAACSEEELPPCPSDDMKEINAPALGVNFKMDRYEASRSSASASSEGSGESRACSVAGVKPWHSATFAEAKAACEASGKHLCTADEWKFVCGNSDQKTLYAYGTTYEAGRCNDSNTSTSSNPTGAAATCKTLLDTYDMSGNLREWVDSGVLLGGGFASSRLEVLCDSAISPPGGADGYKAGTGDGFRCCQ